MGLNDGAPPLFADSVATVRRARPEEVFFLQFQAAPQPGSDDSREAGGAFINCYVDADDLRDAELRALEMIEANHWEARRFETWKLIKATDGKAPNGEEKDTTARELIEQARADGAACAFYCWPIDAPDADDPDA